MVSLIVVFWMFVIIAAVIGAFRGWAKELLVSFSAILALFIILVINTYLPFFQELLGGPETTRTFWFKAVIMLLFAFFGYQTPNAFEKLMAGSRREKARDTVLGIIFGGVNAYLVMGSVWYYLDQAKYPFDVILAPDTNAEFGQLAVELIAKMPPAWLGTAPEVYFAVALAFAFVVIVFL